MGAGGGVWLDGVEAMRMPQVEVLVLVSLVSIVSCLAGSYKPGQTCAQCPGVRIGVGLFEDCVCVCVCVCVCG